MLKPVEVDARIITAMTSTNTDTQGNITEAEPAFARVRTPSGLMLTFARPKRELSAARNHATQGSSRKSRPPEEAYSRHRAERS